MAEKKAAESSTEVPIVVTKRTMATAGPTEMLAATAEEKPVESTPLPRTGKTITPLTSEASTDTAAEPAPETSVPEPSEPAAAGETSEVPEPPQRDSQAAVEADEAKAEAARQARTAELEELIASGKYAVPIDAVGRKRSRTMATVICLVLLLAAVVAVDLLFDLGTLSAPTSVPHTHFFDTK